MKRVIATFTVCATTLMLLVLMPSVSVAADDYGDECPAADANQLVALNSSISGNIDFGGDHDYFRVEVEVAGLLAVWISGQGLMVDTYGYLYDSTCSHITENASRIGNSGFWLSHNTQPGIYFIAVRNELSAGTGSYTLHVDFTPGEIQDDYGHNCATAQLMALDSSIPGNIDFLGDLDFFRVEVTEPGLLTAGTVDPTAINSHGHLYDSNCLLLVEDDNSGGADNFEIPISVVPGHYFIAVRHHFYNISGSTGSYTLEVKFKKGNIQDDYGNDCATEGSLELNNSMAGVMDYIGDYDFFRVEVPEFGLLTVGTIEPTDIDPYGYLHGSDCSIIAENDDVAEGDVNFQISGYAAPGSYFAAVRRFANINLALTDYIIQADFTAGAIPGDINLDLDVDLADLLLILQITTGYMPDNVSLAADVNGDGKIDPRDALYVLQIISGIRP